MNIVKVSYVYFGGVFGKHGRSGCTVGRLARRMRGGDLGWPMRGVSRENSGVNPFHAGMPAIPQETTKYEKLANMVVNL